MIALELNTQKRIVYMTAIDVRPVTSATVGTVGDGCLPFVRFVDAWLHPDEVHRIVQESRIKVSRPVVLAQFHLDTFCNERLEVLYRLGVRGYVIGEPTTQLVARICAPLLGHIIQDTKCGQLRLQDQCLILGSSRADLTLKLTRLCRGLLEAKGSVVSPDRLFNIYHGKVVELNAHTLQTQISRLRVIFASLGLADAIPPKSQDGYRLNLC
jgi:hypothetical protein